MAYLLSLPSGGACAAFTIEIAMHSVAERKSFIFESDNLSEEVLVLVDSTVVQFITEKYPTHGIQPQ